MPQCVMCADEGQETDAVTYRDAQPVCIPHALEWDESNEDGEAFEKELDGWNGVF